MIEHSRAVHIRRPRVDYESHVAHLDRNELGSILVAAGLSSTRDHAPVSLLALNGLRFSEAIGANVEALGLERGHRPLTVLRKGGKLVTMPLAPRVARAIDLAVGERTDGPTATGALKSLELAAPGLDGRIEVAGRVGDLVQHRRPAGARRPSASASTRRSNAFCQSPRAAASRARSTRPPSASSLIGRLPNP